MRNLQRSRGWGYGLTGLVTIAAAVALLAASGRLWGGSARAGLSQEAAESIAGLPVPARATTSSLDYLTSVSCPSSDNCVAAGNFFPRTGGEGGLMPVESNGKWLADDVSADVPSGVSASPPFTLSSVSCPAVGVCTAVGNFVDAGGAQQGLFLSETNGAWTPGREVALPTGGLGGVELSSVSCGSPSACVAVGEYEDPAGDQRALIATETGRGPVNGIMAPLPSAAAAATTDSAFGGSYLQSVSCAVGGACSAVGTYYDSSGMLNGLLLTQNGTGWAAATAPLPPDARPTADPSDFNLTSISCPATNNCAAVGYYRDGSLHEQGVLFDLKDGAWTGKRLALPPDAAADPRVQLASVVCVSVGTCTAVGSYSAADLTGRPLIVSERGGSWSQAFVPTLPPEASQAALGSLGSVACESGTGDCVAVGFYTEGTGAEQGLIVPETGGIWSNGYTADLPSGADTTGHASLNAVSCAASTGCAVVGTYSDAAGSSLPFVISVSPG